jgi:adenylate cyclase
MGYGVTALAMLGEAERTKDWINRALLIEPDNMNMRYNFACAMTTLREMDVALEILGPVFETAHIDRLNHAKVDPDLDPIRRDPRFEAMVASAEARLAAG